MNTSSTAMQQDLRLVAPFLQRQQHRQIEKVNRTEIQELQPIAINPIFRVARELGVVTISDLAQEMRTLRLSSDFNERNNERYKALKNAAFSILDEGYRLLNIDKQLSFARIFDLGTTGDPQLNTCLFQFRQLAIRRLVRSEEVCFENVSAIMKWSSGSDVLKSLRGEEVNDLLGKISIAIDEFKEQNSDDRQWNSALTCLIQVAEASKYARFDEKEEAQRGLLQQLQELQTGVVNATRKALVLMASEAVKRMTDPEPFTGRLDSLGDSLSAVGVGLSVMLNSSQDEALMDSFGRLGAFAQGANKQPCYEPLRVLNAMIHSGRLEDFPNIRRAGLTRLQGEQAGLTLAGKLIEKSSEMGLGQQIEFLKGATALFKEASETSPSKKTREISQGAYRGLILKLTEMDPKNKSCCGSLFGSKKSNAFGFDVTISPVSSAVDGVMDRLVRSTDQKQLITDVVVPEVIIHFHNEQRTQGSWYVDYYISRVNMFLETVGGACPKEPLERFISTLERYKEEKCGGSFAQEPEADKHLKNLRVKVLAFQDDLAVEMAL